MGAATIADGITVADGSFGGGTTLVLGHSQLRVDIDDGQAEIVGSDRDAFGPLWFGEHRSATRPSGRFGCPS